MASTSHSQSPTDDALVARVREGEERAFRQIVERYEGAVASTVVGMLGRGAEADDVGQEVFIRLYENLHQFRGEASLKTYLTRIAINQSLKALRRQKRWWHRFTSRDDPTQTVREPPVNEESVVEERDRAGLVRAALQHLSADHRAVVVLRLLNGYSTAETAEMLDIPEGTVMSRLYRATNRLEELLAPVLQGE